MFGPKVVWAYSISVGGGGLISKWDVWTRGRFRPIPFRSGSCGLISRCGGRGEGESPPVFIQLLYVSPDFLYVWRRVMFVDLFILFHSLYWPC